MRFLCRSCVRYLLRLALSVKHFYNQIICLHFMHFPTLSFDPLFYSSCIFLFLHCSVAHAELNSVAYID